MQVLNRAVNIFVCSLAPILCCIQSGKYMLPLAIAIALHELAHIVTLKALGGRMTNFSPAPFGLCMEYDENSLSFGREALVSAAGCIANLAAALISVFLYLQYKVDAIDFAVVNLMLALVNILPIMPLDGGRILKIAVTSLKGPECAFYVCSIGTYVCSLFMFLVVSYMLLTSQTGIYPLLFSIYLFASNAKMLEKAIFDEKESICEKTRVKRRFRARNRSK